MDSEFKDCNTESLLSDLDQKVETAFRNQLVMTAYQTAFQNYNLDIYMNEVEIHSLGYIQNEPGMTATKLCDLTYRTKGRISSMLSRLEKHGFLIQKINPDNKREHLLYLTEKGEKACTAHREYDQKAITDFILAMSDHCSPAEINGFFKVLQYRSEYFDKIIRQSREEYKFSGH